jgi:two-component system LytT family sensor kinase
MVRIHCMSLHVSRDRLLPVLGVGLILWVISAISAVVLAAVDGRSPLTKLVATLPPLLYWVLLVPVILWLAGRFPLRRGQVLRCVGAHALASVVVAGMYAELMVRLQSSWLPVLGTPDLSAGGARSVRFQFGLLTYGLVLSWGLVHEAFTRMREREVAAARLEGQLAQSQLRVLKAQLQPHFLFNTLHAITVLIRHDPETAARTVTQLSDLLRIAVTDGERQETTLEDELKFLKLYLEIEQTRFGDRLRVLWDVPPPLLRAAVPTLVLQPLVENALKHAIEPSAEGGCIAISAVRDRDLLQLRVGDAGAGPVAASRVGTGLGLSSTRSRLELLYGAAHEFTIEPRPTGGTVVTVAIPFRLHQQPSAG